MTNQNIEPMTTITPTCIQALDDFFGLIQVGEFKAKLRNLLLFYLIHEGEELPDGYNLFIEDMKFLLDCLDTIDKELSKSE